MVDISAQRAGVVGWFRRHADLFRNSGALTIGTAVASVLGFLYWWIAARSFSPEVIGKASALLSLMQLVGLLGDAGIGTLLTGEIVAWPKRMRGLISAAFAASLCLSLVFGGAATILSDLILHTGKVENVLLLMACGLTGLFMVSDQVFVGLMAGGARMLRQFAFSILKVVFIVLSLMVVIEGTAAILASWVISLFLSLVLGEMLLRRSGVSMFYRPDFNLLYTLRQKAVHHYMLDFGIQAPGMIMPYLVTVLLSPTSNAVFTVIWMVFSVASVAPSAFATMLFPVVRADPKQYRAKMILSLSLSLLFAGVFGLFIYFFSTELLTLFNPTYGVIEAGQLSLLGFGMIGSVVKFHVCAAARLSNDMRRASFWFFLGGGLELAGVVLGCQIGGLAGASLGWTLAILIEGGAMLLLANPCRERGVA